MDKETLLSCRDVSLGYEGHTVWEHLTFSVHSGEYLCIVGENGSGKSTLLKSLLGLLPPLKGVIRRSDTAGAVGYLPQQTRAQRDFPATVLEVVLSGCLNRQGLHFFYTPAQRSEAMMNLGKLGILELKDACYRDLSGGQQQRVMIARAMISNPRLLILDEPTTGVDATSTKALYDTLYEINTKYKTTIFMITHGRLQDCKGCDRILRMDEGRIEEQ